MARRGAGVGGFAVVVAVMFVGAAAYCYRLSHAASIIGITSPPDGVPATFQGAWQ